MSDIKFLKWMYDRLILVHGENANYDYMLRLRKIISEMEKGL